MRADDLPEKICPQCRTRTLVQLPRGGVCQDCESKNAWSRYQLGSGRLVVDEAAIEGAEQRRAGELAGLPPWRRALPLIPTLLGLVLAGIAARHAVDVFLPRPMGPLTEVLDPIQDGARLATLLGAAAFILAVVALVRQRRGHLFRVWPLLAANLLVLMVGAGAGLAGGLGWAASAGTDWEHRTMPAWSSDLAASPLTRSIMEGTVVLLAPGVEGDSRGLAIGSGAIVKRTPQRAWILTCSHVAMPYAAVAARRDAATAHPVYVYLSDGRHGEGRVRWTAQPPLDVAVVTIDIADPPAPVPVAPDADDIGEGHGVSFVPNPFRDGWMHHRGSVSEREPHLTPAGEYSLLHTHLPLQGGDSGSGLFDEQGRLVGLNTWTRIGSPIPVGISLPSDAMQALMQRMENDPAANGDAEGGTEGAR